MMKKGINRYWGNSIKNHRGFTLSEALISLLVIGVILACSVPLMTQFSEVKTNLDKTVFDCIVENDSDPWYDESDGDTVVPDSGTDSTCYTAVMDVVYNRGKAFNTAKYYADRGSSTRQEMAKKILRAACDAGGDKACDYFIDKCWGSTDECDLTDAAVEDVNTDVRYYLKKLKTDNNRGVEYIYKKYKTTLPKMTKTLAYEAVLAQIGGDDSLAAQFAKPELFIKACNSGNKTACEISYNFGYNLSCYEIRDHWKEAPSGTYQLTNDASGASHSLYCDMTSEASATISACNQNDLINGRDCLRGKDMHYNQTCDEIFQNWPGAPDGDTFNLTETMVFPFDRDEVVCYAPVGDKDLDGYSVGTGSGGAKIAPPDPTWPEPEPGDEMEDGSLYAGVYDGYVYYTTAAAAPTYSWGATGTEEGVISLSDGLSNTNTLAGLAGDYDAADYCYNLTVHGQSDWYLPAQNEVLNVLYLNRTDLTLGTYIYWTSTQPDDTSPINKINAIGVYFDDGTANYYSKDVAYNLRCVRKEAGTSPPVYSPTCGVVSVTVTEADTPYPIMITTCNPIPEITNLFVADNLNPGVDCTDPDVPCCRYGAGTNCDTEGCGDEVTSGNYDRFTCNHKGAAEVCHALNGANPEQYGDGCDNGECTVYSSGWRLPTREELASLNDSADDLTVTGNTLGFCDYYDVSPTRPYCGEFNGCYVAPCHPYRLWTSEESPVSNKFYYYKLQRIDPNDPGLDGDYSNYDSHYYHSSYRCVRTL